MSPPPNLTRLPRRSRASTTYLPGGKDHFAVDREAAGKLLAVAPVSADVMRENRQFLARAVQWAARQWITQFIDPPAR